MIRRPLRGGETLGLIIVIAVTFFYLLFMPQRPGAPSVPGQTFLSPRSLPPISSLVSSRLRNDNYTALILISQTALLITPLLF